MLFIFTMLVPVGATNVGSATSSEPTAPFNKTYPCLAPPFKPFDDWVKATGAMPPDFAKLKQYPALPPLLEFRDGRPVRTQEDWAARRAEIRNLVEDYLFGHAPAGPPPAFHAEILREVKSAGAIDRDVRLTYDCPGRKVPVTIRVMMPRGKGPFPIFLTQWNHQGWAALAVARGYMACLYPGADGNDQTAPFAETYPQADWSLLRLRGWLCSRVIDYLVTLPEADRVHISLTGHSRNGKQSLVAAAFDERITAVVASSAGSGGEAAWRFTGEQYYNEALEYMTRSTPARTWFLTRLRFFTGREQYLPIDNHALLGLIAPRACLLSDAYNDIYGTTFGNEQSYKAGREVYRFLGHPEALRILYRPGNHETLAKDIEQYFDWYDTAFGRAKYEFPEQLLHAFDWQAWRQKQDPAALAIPADASPRQRIEWSLGQPPSTAVQPGNNYGATSVVTQALVGRTPDKDDDTVARTGFSFGEYVAGDLYYPKAAKGPLPLVVWLHPFSQHYGYNAPYNEPGQIYQVLARQGYMVLVFDQAGFGVRTFEKPLFYRRYPQWSLLGKMVHDVQSALDCILNGTMTADGKGLQHAWLKIPPIDPHRVIVAGYSLGGMVGLYSAALDSRITAVASICGFTPLRTDTAVKPTGGIRRWWELYALQPRLGLYDGKESELPYDYDDVLRLIAPRPCLIVSPLYDREADHADVTRCVESARPAWQKAGRAEALTQLSPPDYNRFQAPQYEMLLKWLGELKE